MTTTDTDSVRIPICDAVRVALVELLTTGQHHHAATPTTLAAVGHTRRGLATRHPAHDPAGHFAYDHDRHAALSSALGDITTALLTARYHRHPDPTRLRAGLSALAAIALGWLDILPTPPGENTDPDYDRPYDGPDAEPF
jgi:hypothetical protein